MPSTVLRHGSVAVRVEAEPEALRWLEEFLVPSLAVAPAAPAEVTVALRADRVAFDALRARGPRRDGALAGCFAFDSRMVALPWWAAAGERIAYAADARVFYRVAPAGERVEVVSDSDDHMRRVPLLRAVREYFMSHAWAPGAAPVHGGALAVGGHGIAIAGAKNAGKTTLLMQLLRAGGAALIANDRIVVAAGGAGLAARGIPTVVKVRRPPAARLPALHELLRGSGANHRLRLAEAGPRSRPVDHLAEVVLSPAQFAALFDVPLEADCRLDALLFPCVDPAGEGLTIVPLAADEAARRLRDCVWGGATPALSELFVLPGRRAAIDVAGLPAWCAAAVRRLRVFECRMGRGADDPEAARRLLDGLAGGRIIRGRI